MPSLSSRPGPGPVGFEPMSGAPLGLESPAGRRPSPLGQVSIELITDDTQALVGVGNKKVQGAGGFLQEVALSLDPCVW